MRRLVIGVLAAVVVVAFVLYIWSFYRPGAAVPAKTGTSTQATVTEEMLDDFAASHAPLLDGRTPPAGLREYHNLHYHFSIFYPSALPLVEYLEDSGGYTISFQGKSGQAGFQIYIVPYAESQISEKQFKLDEPSGVRTGEAATTVDGATAVKFHSVSFGMGDTYEVWFIKNGFLYEVTTYKSLESDLDQILKTWKFI